MLRRLIAAAIFHILLCIKIHYISTLLYFRYLWEWPGGFCDDAICGEEHDKLLHHQPGLHGPGVRHHRGPLHHGALRLPRVDLRGDHVQAAHVHDICEWNSDYYYIIISDNLVVLCIKGILTQLMTSMTSKLHVSHECWSLSYH